VARVRALTGGRGVDVAFEALDQQETFVQAFEMIRDGGRMVPVGIAPGRMTAPIEITRLVRRSLRIIGSFGARTRVDMPDILRLASLGAFRPETMVTDRFTFDDADAACGAVANRCRPERR
jgi:S-(hydroxymethyl)glutathione dehydrogenase/alcohol dehydrogenase